MPDTRWSAANTEARAFLQRRIGQFGLIAGLVSLAAIVFRIGLAFGYGYASRELPHPSLRWHAAAATILLGVWLCARKGKPSVTSLYWIEGVGLVGASAAYTIMVAYLPLEADPGLIAVLAIGNGLFARAIFVPSTARHTAVLGLAISVPLLITVFYIYWHADPEPFQRRGWEASATAPLALASYNAALTVMWWACTTAVCTAASHVIYGLRKEVQEVRKLGQYTLEAKLGEGGMGVVYRASHALLRRPCAVKLLLTRHSSPAAAARFEREVQLTAALTHPNTVTVFDYGRTPEGVFYYAMEYLEGATLSQLIEVDGEQTPARVVMILSQVASALKEAHSIGLIHRDIKPSNIVLTRQGGEPDVAKVLDFGLVKNLQAAPDQDRTHLGEIQGTPQYMAPESITDPDGVDGRADLYALGAVGYFLLTGKHVFSGTTIVEVCGHQLHSQPVPPSTRATQAIPPELEDLILRCLEKSRGDRPANAAALIEALRTVEVPPWTAAQAEQWWMEFGGRLGQQESEMVSSAENTVAVDLARRSVDAPASVIATRS